MSQPFSLGIHGGTGTTKTSIALSFPNPVVFDFDQRLGGVKPELLDKVVKRTSNEYGEYSYPAPIHIPLSGETRGNQQRIMLHGWKEMYDQFIQDLLGELARPDTGTIFIDTGTQMREMANNAYLQELQESTGQGKDMRVQLQQIEYGTPNDRIKAIYATIKGARKYLVVTHYDEDEYVTKEVFDPRNGQMVKESLQTGRRVLKGFNKTAEIMDMMMVTSLELANSVVTPYGTVEKAGLALEMLGVKIQNPGYDSIVGWLRMLRPGSGW